MANYRNVKPVGQMDEMACWAACLAWWLKALGNRPRWSQQDILVKFADMTDDDGSFNVNSFISTVNNMPGLKLKAALFPTNRHRAHRLPIGERPVLIGFRPPEDTGTAPNDVHMNVVIDQANGKVTAMEPYYPFPGQNFRRTGTFLTRHLGFYLDNASDFMLGWATD